MTYQMMSEPQAINQQIVILIPTEISQQFPSRGLVMARGELAGVPFTAPLEPDGKKGHFLLVEPLLAKAAGIKPGVSVRLELALTDDWPEPQLPADITSALTEADLLDVWQTLTVKARWEWLRWIRSTKVAATRQKRIGVAVSKLSQGDRRPCCFNAAGCSLPDISSSGVLSL